MAADSKRTDEVGPQLVSAALDDARSVLVYLVVPESTQYIAIMNVLEGAITDLAPGDVVAQLHASGIDLDGAVVQTRLDQLRTWGAASARTDSTRIQRYVDLLSRNWRYTATPAGRQVQRFYRKVLAGKQAVREIPLTSLARVVDAAEGLASAQTAWPVGELIGTLFVNHDDLDAALVGAEDSLASLADRFDLNDSTAAELKGLLVGYATHVANELDRGSFRVHRALSELAPRFGDLAQATVNASDAKQLIERGALTATHGGRIRDWEELQAWFDPSTGRASRFAMRLVRALPGMHVNLRRLHSSSGAATSRSRALTLARACANPAYGTALFLAALGDHPWRKLYGEAEEVDGSRVQSWREGARVEVPELLRATGRTGARGRAPAARDHSLAYEHVRLERERRAAEHAAAIREVLGTKPGDILSERAARVALGALLAAAAATSIDGRRRAVRNGLACTLFQSPGATGQITAASWRVVTPSRLPIFHLAEVRPNPPRGFQSTDELEPPRLLKVGSI